MTEAALLGGQQERDIQEVAKRVSKPKARIAWVTSGESSVEERENGIGEAKS